MYNLFILGLGGFLGAISRYLLSGYVQNLFKQDGFPYGTLVVNILGCFVLGMLTHAAAAKGMFDAQTRLFLMVGFVGAFTTFSTFSLESASLFQNGQSTAGWLNILGSNLLGLIFVFIGQSIASQFLK
ncbi:MAG TPA: fluoride efflux transporter CrcB [Anaerolineales bacterium]|jgi:CrcB protein|nr:fluoride efflux transporter CrcB [Anaerolineales bacterium]